MYPMVRRSELKQEVPKLVLCEEPRSVYDYTPIIFAIGVVLFSLLVTDNWGRRGNFYYAGQDEQSVYISQVRPRAIPRSPSFIPMTVSLGQSFTLKKNQVATIADTGLEVTIRTFYNSPCVADVQCVWSGVGTEFEYRLNGQVQRGVDLAEAFGYRMTTINTDYETYATLIVEKMDEEIQAETRVEVQ
jgi:hypothetical protein